MRKKGMNCIVLLLGIHVIRLFDRCAFAIRMLCTTVTSLDPVGMVVQDDVGVRYLDLFRETVW